MSSKQSLLVKIRVVYSPAGIVLLGLEGGPIIRLMEGRPAVMLESPLAPVILTRNDRVA